MRSNNERYCLYSHSQSFFRSLPVVLDVLRGRPRFLLRFGTHARVICALGSWGRAGERKKMKEGEREKKRGGLRRGTSLVFSLARPLSFSLP